MRTLIGLATGVVASTSVAILFPGVTDDAPDVHYSYVSTLLVGTLLMLVLALPVGLIGHAVLYALKRRGPIAYGAMGIAGGLAFCMVADWGGQSLTPGQDALLFGTWAGACALIAWAIRRPDKDGKSTQPPPETHF